MVSAIWHEKNEVRWKIMRTARQYDVVVRELPNDILDSVVLSDKSGVAVLSLHEVYVFNEDGSLRFVLGIPKEVERSIGKMDQMFYTTSENGDKILVIVFPTASGLDVWSVLDTEHGKYVGFYPWK